MVFMGVAHVEGVAAPLNQHQDADVQEIRDIFKDGPSQFLNVFVQRHGVGIPTREKIGKDSRPAEVPQGERDAADGKALKKFMISSLREVKHQPSDVSVLILGATPITSRSGARSSRRDRRTRLRRAPDGADGVPEGNRARAPAAMVSARVHSRRQRLRPAAPGRPGIRCVRPHDDRGLPSIATFREVHDRVTDRYPFAWLAVQTILGRLKEPALKAPMTAAEFGTFAVRKFCEEYQRKDDRHKSVPVSLTMLNMSKAPAVFQAAERLAEQLATAGGSDSGELLRIRELFGRSQTIAGKPFIDVADFCVNLARFSTSSDVRGAAADLGNILIDPTTNENGSRSRGSFIVDHSRNLHSTARLHGASLYAPRIIADDWRGPRFFYTKFATQGESSWSRLVHVLAEGG